MHIIHPFFFFPFFAFTNFSWPDRIMKQTIVIRVPISEEKSGSKAMSIASRTKGVTGVEVVKERNYLVVTGEGVDSIQLTIALRKKFRIADIVSVRTLNTRYVTARSEESGEGLEKQKALNFSTEGYQPPQSCLRPPCL